MATYNYYLKDESKDGLSLIMLVYQDKGKKFKMSTKVKTYKSSWDGTRIKGNSLEAVDGNKKLIELESHFNEIRKDALITGESYPIEIVEKKFKVKISATNDISQFFGYWDQFVQDSKATKTLGTIKHYGSTKTRLLSFEKWRKKPIVFEEINQYFYEKFLDYCMTELGLLNNSIGQHVKNLKVFLNYLMNNELLNHKFNLKGFKVYKEDIDIVHLTDDELMTVYNLKGLSPYLERAKDYFCFECFTGLRFSDVGRIKRENIKHDFIEIRTQKTRDSLFIPLNQYALELINKYLPSCNGTTLFTPITNQKENAFLKQVAEIAELDEIVVIEKFSGAKRFEIRKPKYNLVSTHTGRRTFITLSYEKGMKPEIIMKITGIKKWETLKKYLRISEKAKLLEMKKYWDKPKLQIV
jgi:integrase